MKTINKYLRKQISKVFTILAIASLGVSCEQSDEIIDEVTDGFVTMTASTEQGATTRTSLGTETGTKSVLWTEGDKIKVFNADNTSGETFTLATGKNSNMGTFKGVLTGDGTKYAIYPSNISIQNSTAIPTLTFALPSTQIYKANGFDNGVFPMVAVTDGDNFPFKNLCGIIKLSLRGTEKVTQIVITSTEILSGPASVDLSTNTSTPEIKMDASGRKYVRLNCSADGGVQLKASATVDFYIVVPPTVNTAGFTVDIVSTAGVMSKITTQTTSRVVRSMETRMNEFTYLPVSHLYPKTAMNATFIAGSWWAPVNAGYNESTAKEGLLYIWESDGSDGQIGLNPDATGEDKKTPTLGSNHACPEGWERPTKDEYQALKVAGSKWRAADSDTPDKLAGCWFGSGASTATVSDPSNAIFFPAAGYWSNGNVVNRNKNGHYWSSTGYTGAASWYLGFDSNGVSMSSNGVKYGWSVRCVKDAPPPINPVYPGSDMTVTFIAGRWWAPVNAGYDKDNAKEGLLYIWESDGSDGQIGLNPDATGEAQKTPTLGSNHACPEGWERPTKDEYQALIDAGSKWSASGYADTPNDLAGYWFGSGASAATVSDPSNAVFFPAAGYWDSSGGSFGSFGSFNHRGSRGYYWSSTPSGSHARILHFYLGHTGMDNSSVTNGFSVRCVKN